MPLSKASHSTGDGISVRSSFHPNYSMDLPVEHTLSIFTLTAFLLRCYNRLWGGAVLSEELQVLLWKFLNQYFHLKGQVGVSPEERDQWARDAEAERKLNYGERKLPRRANHVEHDVWRWKKGCLVGYSWMGLINDIWLTLVCELEGKSFFDPKQREGKAICEAAGLLRSDLESMSLQCQNAQEIYQRLLSAPGFESLVNKIADYYAGKFYNFTHKEKGEESDNEEQNSHENPAPRPTKRQRKKAVAIFCSGSTNSQESDEGELPSLIDTAIQKGVDSFEALDFKERMNIWADKLQAELRAMPDKQRFCYLFVNTPIFWREQYCEALNEMLVADLAQRLECDKQIAREKIDGVLERQQNMFKNVEHKNPTHYMPGLIEELLAPKSPIKANNINQLAFQADKALKKRGYEEFMHKLFAEVGARSRHTKNKTVASLSFGGKKETP